MAYQHFLQTNGIKASEFPPGEYRLGAQELYNGDLVHFSQSENIREVRWLTEMEVFHWHSRHQNLLDFIVASFHPKQDSMVKNVCLGIPKGIGLYYKDRVLYL